MIAFELCHAMRWSWDDYIACPLYVRRVFWDLLQAKRQAEHDHAEHDMARARNGH